MEPSTSRRSFLLGLTTASAAAALTLAGCGSGGSTAKARGVTAKITLYWPETVSRYIATNVDLVDAIYRYTLNGSITEQPLYFVKPTSGAMPTTKYVYGLPANTQITMKANGFVGYHDWLATNQKEDNDTNAGSLRKSFESVNPTDPASYAPWVSHSPYISHQGADGDTLVWNLVLASFAYAVYFDVTSEQTTEATKPSVNNGVTPRTCNLYAGLTYKITPRFADGDGYTVLAPAGDWALTIDPAYTFTDGSFTVPADAAGTTVTITATWTPKSSADEEFASATARTAQLACTILQGYHKVKFTAAIQPTSDTTIQNLADGFTWTSDKGAAMADGTAGPIANGAVALVKNVAQTVTIAAPAHYIMDTATFAPALTAAGSSVTATTVTVTTEWVRPEIESDYTFTFTASEGVNGVVNIS